MLDEVINRKSEIEDACRRLGVRRLELFGSAARAEGAGQARDFDFLVDLGDVAPIAYADAYFSLREILEALFNRPVDLVTETSISNRYFREGIDRARRLLYAA
jgi:predicted nucleotidyltransferase